MNDIWFWKDPDTGEYHFSRAKDCLDNTPPGLLRQFVHSVDEMLGENGYMWRPISLLGLY